MASRGKRARIAKKRTEIQQAIIALRHTRRFSQQDLANYMHHNTATIGRWEAITPPHGRALAELAKVAHEFERQDLVKVFSQQLDQEVGMMGGGLGAVAHQTGLVTLAPVLAAIENLYECAHADPSRRSVIYRECQKALKAIADSHAVLVQQAAEGKVLKLGEPGYRQRLEKVQIQVEAMGDEEERGDNHET